MKEFGKKTEFNFYTSDKKNRKKMVALIKKIKTTKFDLTKDNTNPWWILVAMRGYPLVATFKLSNGEDYRIFSKDGKVVDENGNLVTQGDIYWRYFLASSRNPWEFEGKYSIRLYHATWGCNVPSILKTGLIPQGGGKTYSFSREGVICVSEYANTCYEMIEESTLSGCSTKAQIESGIVLLEISPWWTKFHWGDINEDLNDRTGSSLQYRGKIPPEAIRVVE